MPPDARNSPSGAAPLSTATGPEIEAGVNANGSDSIPLRTNAPANATANATASTATVREEQHETRQTAGPPDTERGPATTSIPVSAGGPATSNQSPDTDTVSDDQPRQQADETSVPADTEENTAPLPLDAVASNGLSESNGLAVGGNAAATTVAPSTPGQLGTPTTDRSLESESPPPTNASGPDNQRPGDTNSPEDVDTLPVLDSADGLSLESGRGPQGPRKRVGRRSLQNGDGSGSTRDRFGGTPPLNPRSIPLLAGFGLAVAALLALGKGLSTSSAVGSSPVVRRGVTMISRRLRSTSRSLTHWQTQRLVRHLIAWVIDGIGGIWWIIPLGYHKYDDESPLAHESRRMIFEYLEDYPGQTVADVARETDLPRSTVRYHTGILSREDLLTHRKHRGRRRYFSTTPERTPNSPDIDTREAKRALVSAYENEPTAAVLDAISDHNGQATATDLAADLDRTSQTISHHLNHLEEDDLITRTREGRATHVSLDDRIRSLYETISE
jgi:predicted transcriptional regulator